MAKKDNWEWCPYCGGSGTVKREEGKETCSVCHGSGTIIKK